MANRTVKPMALIRRHVLTHDELRALLDAAVARPATPAAPSGVLSDGRAA